MGYIALIGTALSAFGQAKSGQDAKAAYEYNQQLAKYRADVAEDQGDIELAALERDVSGYVSRQRAIAGASGGVTDSGSNLDSLLRTQREADIDASLIRYNTKLAAWSARNQADLLGTQGSNVQSAAYIGTGSTLLGGLSRWDWKKTQLKTYQPPVTPTVRGGYRGSYGL